MSLSPGARLGPYEILGPLGAGGMGEVWRARDPRLGRDVAIKALPAGFAQDPERLARFEREAKLLASLSHPHIAGIHGLEEAGSARYLVLELVSGDTLAQRLGRGRLPCDETLELGRQVAAALEAAHERGVVHRDLKPGNIMLTETGEAKVLDFGLAKSSVAAGAGSSPDLSASPTTVYAATQAGVVLGTAAYMSPEQARGKNVDRRTDIWSFGCVLYECLTGKQAFAGETTSDLVARILEREPDWRALPAGTPPRLVELIKRCLRKDARERLRDIGDARIEIDEIAKGGVLATPGEPAPAGPGRRTLGLAVTAAVLVTALAVAGIMRASVRPPELRPLHLSVQGPEGSVLSDEVPDIVISPDGSRLAFMAIDSVGIGHLWIRPLSSTEPRMLPGTERALIPFWSPDGRNLAFFANASLKRVAVTGDGMQTICPAPNPRGGAWGPDNIIVFAPTANGPLMQVPATGGEPQPATTLDASRNESAHRFPSFLPDGRHFLYAALPGKDNLLDTRVGILGGTSSPPVVTANSSAIYAHPGYLVFMRQSTVFAQRFDAKALRTSGPAQALRDLKDVLGSYSGSPIVSVSADGMLVQAAPRTGNERVDVLDREGRLLGTLPLPSGTFSRARFSRDGRHMAISCAKAGVTAIYLVDLARGLSSRFATDSPYNSAPVWTPDGRRVIYGAERSSGRDLYWKRSDGSGGEELLADVPNLFNDPDDVTPDGKFVLYRSLAGETGEDLWIASLEGSHEARPLLQTGFHEVDAAVSPDGKWMAYRSDESGDFEMYVRSFPTLDRKVRVSIDGAMGPQNVRMAFTRWKNDGRELYYIGRDGRTIMAAPIDPGPEFQVGTPQPLLRLPREVAEAAISPDGHRVYVSVPKQAIGSGIVQIVMNWAGELQEKK